MALGKLLRACAALIALVLSMAVLPEGASGPSTAQAQNLPTCAAPSICVVGETRLCRERRLCIPWSGQGSPHVDCVRWECKRVINRLVKSPYLCLRACHPRCAALTDRRQRDFCHRRCSINCRL